MASQDKMYVKIALILFILIFLGAKTILFTSQPFIEDPGTYQHINAIQNTFQEENAGEILAKDIASDDGLGIYYKIIAALVFLGVPLIGTVITIELLSWAILLLLVYKLAKDVADSRYAGMFAVILTAITPVFFMPPNSRLTPEITIITIILFTTYLLLKSSILFESEKEDKDLKQIFTLLGPGKKKKTKEQYKSYYITLLGFSAIIASLFSPYTLVLVAQLLFFLLISYLEHYKDKAYFREFTTFYLFVSIGFYLFSHQETLRVLKSNALFGNTPYALKTVSEGLFAPSQIFYQIGIIAVLAGIYSIYYYFNNKRLKEQKKIMFHIAGVISAVVPYLFMIGNAYFLLAYTSILLSIIISSFVNRFINHAKTYYKFTFQERTYWLALAIITLSGILSVHYSLAFSIPPVTDPLPQQFVKGSTWINEYGDNRTLVVVPYTFADAAAHFTAKNIIIGNDLISVTDPQRHIRNIDEIYTNINSIATQEILDSYLQQHNLASAYIYFDESIAQTYDISHPGFSYNDECFPPVFQKGNATVYYYQCKGVETDDR